MSHEDELTDSSPIGRFGREGVRDDENEAGRGARAEHAWGVQYQGPFESATDGSARAVRLHARALANAGIPVLLQSFTNSFIGPDGVRVGSEAMDERLKKETHDLRHRSVSSLRLRIKHMVVSSAQDLRGAIIPRSVFLETNIERAMAMTDDLYRSTIIYSVWERSTIDPAIATILGRVAECWVPCEMNKALLREHGVERVVVVPHPWDPASDMAKLVNRRAMTAKRFYAIGLWQPRKRFHETVGAFLLAFRPGDNASLVIKTKTTNMPGYPSPAESGALWLKDPRVIANGWSLAAARSHIEIFDGNWPESKITELHFKNNIYVCASSGEAFCLPAFDAKVAGNRMILVGYNGARDFSSETTDPLIPYEMKPVPTEYGWEPNAMWAEARVEDIAKAMQTVPPPSAYVRPERLKHCTIEAVGQLMRERCEAVLAKLSG